MKAAVSVVCLGLMLVCIAAASDSLNVRFLGRCDTPGTALCLALEGDYAYVVDAESGLRVVSVADPAHPLEVGHFRTQDVDGASVSAGYAYVAEWPSGLRIISITDPAHPTEVGYCATPDWSASLSVNGNYAYLAQHDSGLRVISIADPAHPSEVGHCDLPGSAVWIDVVGEYAYVAAYDSGMVVVSIADSTHPAVAGHVDTPGQAAGVAVAGGYAYVADFPDLRVISVADPGHPVEVGHHTCPNALGVAASGTLVYLASMADGVRIVSVADPANPTEVGYYRGGYLVPGVAVDGDYVYATSADSGLQIYQFYGTGVEESPLPQAARRKLEPTILSGASAAQCLASRIVLDAMGRRVVNPKPGVYFVRDEGHGAGDAGRTRKVVVQR